MKNQTMQNSASNPLIIQALQTQAQRLLPLITQTLCARQYSEIIHQRIAQQYDLQTRSAETTTMATDCYQGLTRAKHPQFGSVMIKWQLNVFENQDLSGLTHEYDVLKSLNALLQNQSAQKAFIPSVFAFDTISIQAMGQSQRLMALVMPYYPNGNLAKQLTSQNGPSLTDNHKHHFIKQAAYLVAKLHHAGWLHNDIKPSNILLDAALENGGHNINETSELVMIDFALAQTIHQPINSNPAGTPAYLAPERWQGQRATIQSDIYAFGIMMVEILMGERPFKIAAESIDPMIDWATQHCQQPVPRLPSEYSSYQFIVDDALAKRVEKRYQSMDEVLANL
ncbi:serine/threonine protein kinase [Psychrobacter alimentarius]|uniref:serine/threonine protein kinase n=1 Tax=Psychrobacter alimentarius TaxID=261164 RepID=UPI001D126E8E|nr:protein kinase [Psychrobacter alimentarius]